jgi:Fe-S-cluster-containing hydrogenase component 2
MDDYPRITNEDGCYRCQHCLAVCPTGAVSILGRDPDASTELAGNMPDAAGLETLIKGRRSVRRYSGRDLNPALIDELLDIACHAPTGVNAQAVLFTVVREGAVMKALREEVMAQLTKLQAAGKLPEGLVAQYIGGAVKAWQEESKDMVCHGLWRTCGRIPSDRAARTSEGKYCRVINARVRVNKTDTDYRKNRGSRSGSPFPLTLHLVFPSQFE